MSNKISKASLRICTDETDVNFISEALNVDPDRKHIKSMGGCDKRLEEDCEQSVWIYRSKLPDSAAIHDHLNELLKLLESRQRAFQGIRNRLSTIDLFCMFSSGNGQGSADINSILLRRLADQQIDLIIDLYPPDEI